VFYLRVRLYQHKLTQHKANQIYNLYVIMSDNIDTRVLPSSASVSSTRSSTFSEYVGKVFPKAKGFGEAVTGSIGGMSDVIRTSVGEVGIPQTLQNLSAAIQEMATQYNTSRVGRVLVIGPNFEDVNFSAAAKLNDDTIRSLLNAGELEPEEINMFFHMLKHAQDMVFRKRQSMLEQQSKRDLKSTFGSVVCPVDLFQRDIEQDLTGLFADIGYTLRHESSRVLFIMAITHESVYAGRETNRVLAHYGDSVARMVMAKIAIEDKKSVGDLDALIQLTQCNDAWNRIMVENELNKHVRVDTNMVKNVTLRIASTVFEAILGATHVDGGWDGLMEVNEKLHWIGEFDSSTPKSMPLASPRASVSVPNLSLESGSGS